MKITAKARQFIVALSTSSTTQEAIDATGVNPHTAYRWLKDPDFTHELREARRQVLFHSTSRLTSATERAVDTLLGVMDDDGASASAKVSAARAVLDAAYNAAQVDDVIERIEKLEKNNDADD